MAPASKYPCWRLLIFVIGEHAINSVIHYRKKAHSYSSSPYCCSRKRPKRTCTNYSNKCMIDFKGQRPEPSGHESMHSSLVGHLSRTHRGFHPDRTRPSRSSITARPARGTSLPWRSQGRVTARCWTCQAVPVRTPSIYYHSRTDTTVSRPSPGRQGPSIVRRTLGHFSRIRWAWRRAISSTRTFSRYHGLGGLAV